MKTVNLQSIYYLIFTCAVKKLGHLRDHHETPTAHVYNQVGIYEN